MPSGSAITTLMVKYYLVVFIIIGVININIIYWAGFMNIINLYCKDIYIYK